MKESFIQLYSTHRRHLYVAAYVVLISVVALTTYFAGSYYYGSNFVVAPHLESAPTTTPSYPYVLHASKPKRLSIPKLSIDTSFEILSLNPDRSIGVPKEYTTVGCMTVARCREHSGLRSFWAMWIPSKVRECFIIWGN